MKRYEMLYFSKEHADFVMGMAAEIARGVPVFRWVHQRRRKVWAKITSAFDMGESEPEWSRYAIVYDLGLRCRGWPRDDGAPSVQAVKP